MAQTYLQHPKTRPRKSATAARTKLLPNMTGIPTAVEAADGGVNGCELKGHIVAYVQWAWTIQKPPATIVQARVQAKLQQPSVDLFRVVNVRQ